MTIITWPSTTKEIIDDIRTAIGRVITFYTETVSGCSVCSLDPISNESTDSFCPSCSGLYWIPVLTTSGILAHITWGSSESLNWVSGGQLFEGDCRVQIEYTPEHITVVDTSAYVEVDGKKMDINKKILRGVQPLNRILLDLKERDKVV